MIWLVVVPMSGGGGGNGGLGFGRTVALLELLAPNWGMEG